MRVNINAEETYGQRSKTNASTESATAAVADSVEALVFIIIGRICS